MATFSSDGRFLLTGDNKGTVMLTEIAPVRHTATWSYAFPRPATDRRQEAELVNGALEHTVSLIADGRFGAAAAEIREARTLPGYRRHHALLDRWRDIGHILEHFQKVPWPGPVLSRDDRFIITAEDPHSIRVWDTATGTCLSTLDGHTDEITWLGVSADGHRIVSVEKTHRAYVWELAWDYAFEPQDAD